MMSSLVERPSIRQSRGNLQEISRARQHSPQACLAVPRYVTTHLRLCRRTLRVDRSRVLRSTETKPKSAIVPLRSNGIRESTSMTHKGQCFCGSVQVEVTGEPVAMGYCHCNSCRSWSGAPVNAFSLWKPEAVKFTRGAKHVATFQKTPF